MAKMYLEIADGEKWYHATNPEGKYEEVEVEPSEIFSSGGFVPSGLDEITLLKAQNQALGDRLDFMEDCIAEMAAEVYA